jgi:hypothetical protein
VDVAAQAALAAKLCDFAVNQLTVSPGGVTSLIGCNYPVSMARLFFDAAGVSATKDTRYSAILTVAEQ